MFGLLSLYYFFLIPDWQKLLDLSQNHDWQLTNFSSLLEVFLVVGFAYHSIPKVKELLNEYMAKSYSDFEAYINLESGPVIKVEPNPKDGSEKGRAKLLAQKKSALNKLKEKVVNRKVSMLRNNGHTFFILGLYCLVILVVCSLEGIILNGYEFLRFKNALVFFNIQVVVYLFCQYFFNKTNSENLYTHLIYVGLFCFSSFAGSYSTNFTFNMLVLFLLTLLNIFLPFLLICISAYRLRETKVWGARFRLLLKGIDELDNVQANNPK